MDDVNKRVPPAVLEAFRTGVAALLSERDYILKARLKDARIAAVETFAVGLDQISSGRQKLDPIRIGWRVAATSDQGLLLSADLAERNGVIRVVSVSREKDEPDLETLFAEAGVATGAPLEGYSLGLLQIPGLLMDALLIAPRDGSERRIFPIIGPAEVLPRRKLYLETEFLNLIRTPIPERGGLSLLDRFRTPPKRKASEASTN